MASITLIDDSPTAPSLGISFEAVQYVLIWLAIVPFTLSLGVVLTSVMVPRNCWLLARRLFA